MASLYDASQPTTLNHSDVQQQEVATSEPDFVRSDWDIELGTLSVFQLSEPHVGLRVRRGPSDPNLTRRGLSQYEKGDSLEAGLDHFQKLQNFFSRPPKTKSFLCRRCSHSLCWREVTVVCLCGRHRAYAGRAAGCHSTAQSIPRCRVSTSVLDGDGQRRDGQSLVGVAQ